MSFYCLHKSHIILYAWFSFIGIIIKLAVQELHVYLFCLFAFSFGMPALLVFTKTDGGYIPIRQ